MRRGTFRDGTVDYAAVGATQASDLLQFPPERSVPAQKSWKLGSGDARFEAASDALLSWAPLRGAGLTLSDIRPAPGPGYSGVSYDESGAPVAPARRETEQRFDAEGTPYVSAGASVRVSGRVKAYLADAELRVILAIEEARRTAFALGTIGGSVVSGEELFLVEWRENDEVWFTVRAFDTPVSTVYKLFPRLVRGRRDELFRRYLQSVSPLFAS